jgi:acyl-CoA thioesterase-1
MVRLLLSILVLAAMSCGSRPAPADTTGPGAAIPPDAPSTSPPPAPVPVGEPRIVALGDSLTAGLGLAQDMAFPAQLERKLAQRGHSITVANAGVSGDTAADGLRRANWALEGNVKLLIVALGANDGLRGLPPPQMKENLQGIIHRARQRGVPVLLAGMEAPPNYGEQYAAAFRQVFRDLARENKVTLVPFLLEGVAGVVDLNQGDGIHPTSEGAARIADLLLPTVEEMIEPIRAK